MPDGRLLVTERGGTLQLVTQAGAKTAIGGVPSVVSAGQGGLLDVALDPQYAANRRVYLSFSEAGTGGAGLAVARGTLDLNANRIDGVTTIWRQVPKNNDTRHFGGRMAFSPDGFLFVTAGERHQGAPAQDLSGTLGKIVRLNPDGTTPAGNPFAATANARTEIWTLGHRNPYGLVFASDGRLFESEMGPDAGDEFNLIARGSNYGWRVVAEGSDGDEALPRHATRPEFAAPAYFWVPNIAPAGMIQYTGTRFIGWNGDFVLPGWYRRGWCACGYRAAARARPREYRSPRASARWSRDRTARSGCSRTAPTPACASWCRRLSVAAGSCGARWRSGWPDRPAKLSCRHWRCACRGDERSLARGSACRGRRACNRPTG